MPLVHMKTLDGVVSQAFQDANAAQAEFVELWTFAFLQGYKNVGQPDLEIPYEARERILAAFANACAKSPDMTYVDLAALGAKAVKLQK